MKAYFNQYKKTSNMNYYHSKLLVNVTFDEAVVKVTEALEAKALAY